VHDGCLTSFDKDLTGHSIEVGRYPLAAGIGEANALN
jgi:hypothetical protein